MVWRLTSRGTDSLIAAAKTQLWGLETDFCPFELFFLQVHTDV